MKTRFFFAAVLITAILAVSCNNDQEGVLAVRLDKTKVELVKGESLKLNAKVVPDQEADFTWYSQDEQYVTVDQDGVITAVALKMDPASPEDVLPVSVYVKYGQGADECQVTVLPLAPSKVEIVNEGNGNIVIDPQEQKQLTAKIYPEEADLTELTWSVDYASVVTVDSKTGLITGVNPGFAEVKASYNEKIYSTVTVQVNHIDPTGVSVDPSTLTMSVGAKKRLKALLTPSNATGAFVWTSDDMNVATVDSETGYVTAVAPGTANIKVQVGKVSAVCAVTVK